MAFYWHGYHNGVWAAMTAEDAQERREYIATEKPLHERKFRLLMFRKVKSKLDLNDLPVKQLLALHKKECPGCPMTAKGSLFKSEDEGGNGTSQAKLDVMYKKVVAARKAAERRARQKRGKA